MRRVRQCFQAFLGSAVSFICNRTRNPYITKRSRKKEVAETIRAIFDAENTSAADRLLKIAIEKYAQDMPQLTQWMEAAIPEGFTVFHFSVKHRRRLRTSNIAERVNQEIRRRTRVARIFPNVESCERLVGAIVMEIIRRLGCWNSIFERELIF